MKLSPLTGVPIAEPDDFATNYPVEIDEPRTIELERFANLRFANESDRDAKIPNPVNGMKCYLEAWGQYQGYVDGWYPIGGQMPWGWVTWGALNVPLGENRIVAVPQSYHAAGGVDVDISSSLFSLSYNGLYVVRIGINIDSLTPSIPWHIRAGELVGPSENTLGQGETLNVGYWMGRGTHTTVVDITGNTLAAYLTVENADTIFQGGSMFITYLGRSL